MIRPENRTLGHLNPLWKAKFHHEVSLPVSGLICRWLVILLFAAGILRVSLAWGESVPSCDKDPNTPPEIDPSLFDLPLEDLMNIEVISALASRQAQTRSWASMPVSVMTTDDIHYGGFTNIPDVLMFMPGVDVLSLDNGSYAVGVRGLHDTMSDRTLFLVDGRSADTPIIGGVSWLNLPVLMEDIESIEVVRGPGGAAWGANSLTGVINITTKEPEKTQGVLASTTFDHFGQNYSHWRWADHAGKWSWKVSGGYRDTKSSEDTIDPALETLRPELISYGIMDITGFKPRDAESDCLFDTKANYRASEDTTLSFGSGYSHSQRGAYEWFGYFPRKAIMMQNFRNFAKWNQVFSDEIDGYLMYYHNRYNYHMPNIIDAVMQEHQLENQMNFALSDTHKLSTGGNFRWIHLNSSVSDPQDLEFPDEPLDEYSAGMFLMDRYQLAEKTALEGQYRTDWFSATTVDWASRLTVLQALDDKKQQVVRFSGARSFRAPLAGLREAQYRRLPNPYVPGTYVFNFERNEDLDNESIWTLETGYDGLLNKNVQWRTNAFYQRFDDLVGVKMVPDPYGNVRWGETNFAGAHAVGSECELEFNLDYCRLTAWYAYMDFQPDRPAQNMRGHLPAPHKAGLTGRVPLGHGFTLAAFYRYTGTTPGEPIDGLPVSMFHRFDAMLSKSMMKGRGELLVGIADMFNRTRPVAYGLGSETAYETPGRRFFTRLEICF